MHIHTIFAFNQHQHLVLHAMNGIRIFHLPQSTGPQLPQMYCKKMQIYIRNKLCRLLYMFVMMLRFRVKNNQTV